MYVQGVLAADLATRVSTRPWPGGRLVTVRSGLAPDTETTDLGDIVIKLLINVFY